MVPYRANMLPSIWRWWYAFGAGDMGNDGVHDIDYTRWGLGVETQPSKVSAIGGKFFQDDDQEFPDTQQVAFEYPDVSGGRSRMLIYEQRLWSTNYPRNCDSGAEFYGTKGQLFLSRRGKIELLGERNQRADVAVQPGSQNDVLHVANFCDAIRGRGSLNADALVGHLSASLCHLGNIATRLGRSLDFDPVREQVLNDPEANALVRREYRDHWGSPRDA
jgi:predicted dehydrogenase